MTRTTDTTTTDQSLVTGAAGGDAKAFDELHRRHAPLAWRLALAITGNPTDAATAVAEGTGTTFTAVRAGRTRAASHPIALATATRNAALDLRRSKDAVNLPVAADGADPVLAGAFYTLPERWRSVLWLRDAEGLDAGKVAPVVELTAEAVDQLAVRARRGLRERYLRSHVATTAERDCTRATNRLGALADGTLNDPDQANLERHLAHCERCTKRLAAIIALPAGLAALAVAAPADLHNTSRAAWSSALATTSSTGLSPRTEKILAGASAFAAAVGVLGAALFGTGGSDDPVASPLAPLVADIDAPRPIDLTALALPVLEDPLPVRSSRPLTTSSPAPRGTSAGGEVAAPTSGAPATGPSGTSTSTDPGTPAAEAPSSPGLGQLPVDVNLGTDTSVGVGPISVDLDPEPDQGTVAIDTPPALDPIVDPVVGIVNTVTTPVVDALEPVLDAVEPITTGVNELITRIGL
jgi:DNA-directed RNA polymerase specialized sigma24 family protein/anti-sigma factor RsiW